MLYLYLKITKKYAAFRINTLSFYAGITAQAIILMKKFTLLLTNPFTPAVHIGLPPMPDSL